MQKHYETVTDERGNVLAGYRVRVKSASGVEVPIFADSGGTNFRDAAGSVINETTTNDLGHLFFYWTPEEGQSREVLTPSGDLKDRLTDFSPIMGLPSPSDVSGKANKADVAAFQSSALAVSNVDEAGKALYFNGTTLTAGQKTGGTMVALAAPWIESSKVSYGAGTVEAALDGVNSGLSARPTSAALAADGGAALIGSFTGKTLQHEVSARNTIDLEPVILDMHFGVMRGAGWVAGEPGDGSTQYASTFTASAAAGATSVTVASGTYFRDGQLIAFQGADGKYYTTRISTKSGTTLTLAEPLPAAVATGGNVGIWFNDYNHPREWGRFAIGDYVVDTLATAYKRELVAVQRDYSDWTNYLSGAVSALGTLSYGNPASNLTGAQAAKVDNSAQYGGARSIWVSLPAGEYEVTLPVNPGNVGGARNTVQVFVEIEHENGDMVAFGTKVVTGLNSIQLVTMHVTLSARSRARVYAQGMVGASTFNLGPIRWYRRTGKLASLESGTWVGLGDSWFATPWALDRIAARLPDITMVNKGVSGNTAADLVARFDTDVTPHNPRVVLICVGTNDWAAGVARGLFHQNMGTLIRKCQAIGAQAVILTPSVGDAATGAQLQNSRGYASKIEHESAAPFEGHTVQGASSAGPITIAAGAEVALFVSQIPVSTDAIVDTIQWNVSSAAVQIHMGYSSALPPSLPVTLDNEMAYSATAFEAYKIVVEKSAKNNTRFFVVRAKNTDAASQTVNFFNVRARLMNMFNV